MILYVSRSSGLSKTLICQKPCTDHCKAPLIIYIWKGRYINANLLLLLLLNVMKMLYTVQCSLSF